MADSDNKHPDNAPGPYYVDDSCISCGVCIETAPDNFDLDDYTDQAYVFKQPENRDERDECRLAMNSCPADAIGDDG